MGGSFQLRKAWIAQFVHFLDEGSDRLGKVGLKYGGIVRLLELDQVAEAVNKGRPGG